MMYNGVVKEVPNTFPGSNAGASLKLAAVDLLPRLRQYFPRQQCRGLIQGDSVLNFTDA